MEVAGFSEISNTQEQESAMIRRSLQVIRSNIVCDPSVFNAESFINHVSLLREKDAIKHPGLVKAFDILKEQSNHQKWEEKRTSLVSQLTSAAETQHKNLKIAGDHQKINELEQTMILLGLSLPVETPVPFEPSKQHRQNSRSRRMFLKSAMGAIGLFALGGTAEYIRQVDATRGVTVTERPKFTSKALGKKESTIPQKPHPPSISSPTITVSPVATLETPPTATATATTTIIKEKSLPSSSPSPTETPTPAEESKKIAPESISEAESTELSIEINTDIEDKESDIIGEKNIAEFLLGDLVEQFKQRGIEQWHNDPSYRDRVSEEAINSDHITFVYLGIDETRERIREFSGNGSGRSDVIMVITFDPHTFQTTTLSIPRDTFSQEVVQLGAGWDKINSGTMSSFVKEAYGNKYANIEDSLPFMQRVLESATGLRIDGLIESNIDFMQGYEDHFDKEGEWQEGRDGIFNMLFPQGLSITPPRSLTDREYPKGYGTIKVDFKEGEEEKMDGWRLVQWARMRHADSDHGRAERQRTVLKRAAQALIPSFVKDYFPETAVSVFQSLKPDFFKDHTDRDSKTIDVIINALEQQQELNNLFQHNVDIIEVMKQIKGSLESILKRPDADKLLALLALNSKDNLLSIIEDTQDAFHSYGLGTTVELGVYNLSGSTLALNGSQPQRGPNTFGNFKGPWQPLRNFMAKKLFGENSYSND